MEFCRLGALRAWNSRTASKDFTRVTRVAAVRVYKTGFDFFILQICNNAFFKNDAILIVRFLTVNQVTPYSVAQKVFLQVDGLLAIAMGSLWAAYGNAKAKGDYDWIRRTHTKMIRAFALCYSGLSVFMILFGHRLLAWWVGATSAPGVLLILGVAFYYCARGWNGLHAMLLNGLNVVRPQVWNLTMTAILTLGLDLVLVKPLGPVGLAIGGAAGSILGSAWYLPPPHREDASPSGSRAKGS